MLSSGDLDPTFGIGGIVTTSLPETPTFAAGRAMAIQPDGKIVVVGVLRAADNSTDAVIARYLNDGSLDTSFGSGGFVVQDTGVRDEAHAVAIDANGKIVIGGTAGGEHNMMLARYNGNGTLDATFGGGIVQANFERIFTLTGVGALGGNRTTGADIAIQGDGKVVIVGANLNFVMARFNPNGTLDNDFGTGGLVVTDVAPGLQEGAEGVAVNPTTGGIVVTGSISGSVRRAAVARYNNDGSLDSSFAGDGTVVFDVGGREAQGSDVAIDANGKIVGAGRVIGPNGGLVFRINDDGSFDSSFDSDGLAELLGSDFAGFQSLLIQADGKIVAAGSDRSVVVTRWNTDGSRDSTFGVNGVVRTNVSSTSAVQSANDVAIQSDGRIVIAGVGVYGVGDGAPNNILGLARYLADCDPIGWWRADGNAADSADGNDGQLLNGATFAPGQLAQAFDFDGLDDALQVLEDGSELDGFSQLTVAAWVNVEGYLADASGATLGGIVTKYDSTFSTGVTYTFFTRDNRNLGFYVAETTSDYWIVETDANTLDFDKWTHVAGVWYGQDNFALYVDGLEVSATLTKVGSPSQMSSNNVPVNIGRYESVSGSYTGPAGHFDGLIDDVRIYSCGLDDTRIHEIYLDGANQPVNVAGRIYDDANNDGSDAGETGLSGLTVTLTGADDNGPVNLTTATMSDGSYVFEEVLPGTYSITAEQPAGLLDAKETAGNFAGTVDNSQDSNTIADIVIGNDGVDATGYNFGNIRPSVLSGLVWADVDENGQVDLGEAGIETVFVQLSGTDDRGNAVSDSAQTDPDGSYVFSDLRPGVYALVEVQPAEFLDGREIVGTIQGTTTGESVLNDEFSGISLTQPGLVGLNYNFSERPRIAPTASVAGPTMGVRGKSQSFQLQAQDVSPSDNAAGFEYSINWGDGSPLQIVAASPNNGSGISLDHVFTTAGSFTVSVVATDQGTEASTPTMATITIDVAAVIGSDLVVGGTDGNDVIHFARANSDNVKVFVNGDWFGPFTASGRLMAYGGPGNDLLSVGVLVNRDGWLFGGDGNDLLNGGTGDDLLEGDDGDDLAFGGFGRDVIIGGRGSDGLFGNFDEDIIIAGTTAHDGHETALEMIMAEWKSSRSFASRVANLQGTGTGQNWTNRANGQVFLVSQPGSQPVTVLDDEDEDVLVGGLGTDWFFANLSGSGVQDCIADLNWRDVAIDLVLVDGLDQ